MTDLLEFPELHRIEKRFNKMVGNKRDNIVYVFYAMVSEDIIPTEYCKELIHDCQCNEFLILKNKFEDIPFYLMYKNIKMFNKKMENSETSVICEFLINDFSGLYYEMLDNARNKELNVKHSTIRQPKEIFNSISEWIEYKRKQRWQYLLEENKDGQLQITIIDHLQKDCYDTDKKGENITIQFSAYQYKIMKILWNSEEPLTVRQIAKECNDTSLSIRARVFRLKKMGAINTARVNTGKHKTMKVYAKVKERPVDLQSIIRYITDCKIEKEVLLYSLIDEAADKQKMLGELKQVMEKIGKDIGK